MLTQAIGDTKEKLATLKIAAEQANKQLQNGEITQQQYDALQWEIIAIEAELRRLENQASKTNKMFSSIGNIGANIEKAGDSVTNVGMKTSDVSKMVNQMAKTSSTTNTSVAQLGEGILTIGATAKSVKGGTAELNAKKCCNLQWWNGQIQNMYLNAK